MEIVPNHQTEAELRESRQRTELALAVGRVHVFDVALDGRRPHDGSLLRRLLGLEREEFHPQEEWLERIHPEDRAGVEGHGRTVFDPALPVDREGHSPLPPLEFRVLEGEDAVRWLLTRSKLLRHPDGGPARVVGTVTDISDRRLAEEAALAGEARLQHAERELRQSQKRYEMATAAAGVGVWDMDLATGEVYCDPVLPQLLGDDIPWVLANRDEWMTRIHPEDRERSLACEQAALAPDAPRDAEGNTPIPEVEYRILRRDGSTLWVANRGIVLRDAEGRPYRVIGAATNITARKQAEEATREREARLRAVLSALPDMMFLQDRETRYLDFHARDRSVLLVAPEEFLGKKASDVLPPDLHEGLSRCMAEAFETGGPSVLEYSVPILGQERHYEARTVRCDPDTVLSIVRDITERKVAEAALRHSHARIRNLARRLIRAQETERRRIARDLHDDLAQKLAALGIALSGLKRYLPADGAAGTQFAGLQERLLEIAQDIRSLSHQLHPALLEHAGLGTALRAHCEEVSRQTGTRVDLELEGDLKSLPPDVALCLFRIAQEALWNSARHARATQATVSLTRVEAAVGLRLRDTGAGFDLASARAEGGLGLVSMEERAHALGGTLQIGSSPGAGTELEVWLPLEPDGSAEAAV